MPSADWLLSAVLMRESVAITGPRALRSAARNGFPPDLSAWDYRVWRLGSRLELEYDSQTAHTVPGFDVL
ncbi:hypothetical protein QQF64_022398 [Cirrhinus molitorella]|uniref:Uncharacterized protein n=1 Tax=Cirrhinus molitorella TaxID=172907 RepID=A0ABR3L827_9TELE